MGFLNKLLVCALCVHFVGGENAYRAAVVSSKEGFSSYTSLISEAAEKNADILVLPAPKVSRDGPFAGIDNYDEITKSISSAAKQAKIYVVAHLFEKAHCQNTEEVMRSNLVFDRQGSIVAVYRKTINKSANCTTSVYTPSFSTDFGVSFGLLMEEDLVLKKPEEWTLKNFLVTGALQAGITFLRGPQLASSWSYVTNANLITSCGIYAGRSGLKAASGRMAVVQLKKQGGEDSNTLISTPAITSFPSEDLSQYVIRPLDVEASIRGYKQTVCHLKFCCEFYVKTSYIGSPHHEVSYGLAAFDGVRHYADTHHIGAQSCSIVACAGLYKRSCMLGPRNSTNTLFEKIQIRGNFTYKESAQFPVIISTSGSQNINFDQNHYGNINKVTISISKAKDVLNFGIFGRVYSKDFDVETDYVQIQKNAENFYDYFFNEDVMEFFDYVWIRLRILIFIVSIYVLEMM